VIFTDLDGTLLDPATYSWAAAQEALERCRRLSIPIILNSSKTHAEIAHLRHLLRLPWPYIVENGGGILYPSDSPWPCPPDAVVESGYARYSIGASYDCICEALRRLRQITGYHLRGFSDMPVTEIRELTGLDEADALRASRRDYDEPFVLDRPEPAKLERLVREADHMSLRVTPGGRFHHLHGQFDKGAALRILIRPIAEAGRPVRTIGLGDSENDIPMLEAVEVPVWVGGRDKPAPVHIPGLILPPGSGPLAWNQAVLRLL
jgi:mannosyl-3-phosphoglycerate phosphatase